MSAPLFQNVSDPRGRAHGVKNFKRIDRYLPEEKNCIFWRLLSYNISLPSAARRETVIIIIK